MPIATTNAAPASRLAFQFPNRTVNRWPSHTAATRNTTEHPTNSRYSPPRSVIVSGCPIEGGSPGTSQTAPDIHRETHSRPPVARGCVAGGCRPVPGRWCRRWRTACPSRYRRRSCRRRCRGWPGWCGWKMSGPAGSAGRPAALVQRCLGGLPATFVVNGGLDLGLGEDPREHESQQARQRAHECASQNDLLFHSQPGAEFGGVPVATVGASSRALRRGRASCGAWRHCSWSPAASPNSPPPARQGDVRRSQPASVRVRSVGFGLLMVRVVLAGRGLR